MSNLLLVSHGSRDPRPQVAVAQLAELLLAKLPNSYIGTATLELGSQPLHGQIRDFIAHLPPQSPRSLHILPLFLLPGSHVMQDIPAEIDLALSTISPSCRVQVLPHLGSHGGMFELLSHQQQAYTGDKSIDVWILLAHGSKYNHAHQSIKELAHRLNAIPAYWAVSPSLETQVEMLIDQGYESLGILPYFLFSGGITDAIARKVDNLQEQFFQTQIILADPLGTTPLLAEMVLSLISEELVEQR
jgi:sirohydrochlorin cobaltochelatase